MNRRSLLASLAALVLSPRLWFVKAPSENFDTLGLQMRGYRTFDDTSRTDFSSDEPYASVYHDVKPGIAIVLPPGWEVTSKRY